MMFSVSVSVDEIGRCSPTRTTLRVFGSFCCCCAAFLRDGGFNSQRDGYRLPQPRLFWDFHLDRDADMPRSPSAPPPTMDFTEHLKEPAWGFLGLGGPPGPPTVAPWERLMHERHQPTSPLKRPATHHPPNRSPAVGASFKVSERTERRILFLVFRWISLWCEQFFHFSYRKLDRLWEHRRGTALRPSTTIKTRPSLRWPDGR